MIYGVYGAGGHGCEAMQVFLSNLHLVQEANLIDLFLNIEVSAPTITLQIFLLFHHNAF